MFFLHPFHLLTVTLPFIWLAVLFNLPAALRRWRGAAVVGSFIILVLAEWWLVAGNNSTLCQYKAVTPALNVENNRVVHEVYSPRGYYQFMDNYSERLDVDLSNNYGLLGAGGPPAALGLYRDGDRLTAFPKPGPFDLSYLKAALDSLPYRLRKHPQVLLIGARGGFRISEVLTLGAARIDAVETDRAVYDTLLEKLPGLLSQAGESGDRVKTAFTSPQSFLAESGRKYDIVDVSSEFLDQGQANKYIFTVEGVRALYRGLSDQGLLSLPMSISEFTVYAVKAVNTVRQALIESGVAEPESRLMVYRSAWNCRIIVSKRPLGAEDLQGLLAFCSDRSFDASYYPGINPSQVKIWNDLPQVSFQDRTMSAGGTGPRDALMEDLVALLGQGEKTSSTWTFFNLEPSTYDRPSFYSILLLKNLRSVLSRIDLVPRPEMGYLINLAVLAQAVLFALVVLFLPFLRRRKIRIAPGNLTRGIIYFLCLGLGFLFVEITLIERFAFFLNDAVLSFGLVLSAMLIFSGLGSGFCGRFLSRSQKGVRVAVLVIIIILAAFTLVLSDLLVGALDWPPPAKYLIVLLTVAPLAFAMGMPFPLGLSRFRGQGSAFLPWAWSINGAFSVIATPLANILAVTHGYSVVLIASMAAYFAAAVFVPREAS
ncbi:MAG: hypothetical protein V1742_10805, partial [Pseudomonadota bacterium]